MAASKRAAADYIVFPLDVPRGEEALDLAGRLAGCVGLFKIGLELFIQGGGDLVRRVRDKGKAGIFLDLKLHDIPVTVARAVSRLAQLDVALTTVHCGESPAMLDAAVESAGDRVGILGVTVLTSVSAQDLKYSGYRAPYSNDVAELVIKRAAMAHETGCTGIICSGHEAAAIKHRFGPDFLAVTPGIRPLWEAMSPDDQKRVTTPAMAVQAGADYIVIGRPIRDAADPAAAARRVADEIGAVL